MSCFTVFLFTGSGLVKLVALKLERLSQTRNAPLDSALFISLVQNFERLMNFERWPRLLEECLLVEKVNAEPADSPISCPSFGCGWYELCLPPSSAARLAVPYLSLAVALQVKLCHRAEPWQTWCASSTMCMTVSDWTHLFLGTSKTTDVWCRNIQQVGGGISRCRNAVLSIVPAKHCHFIIHDRRTGLASAHIRLTPLSP